MSGQNQQISAGMGLPTPSNMPGQKKPKSKRKFFQSLEKINLKRLIEIRISRKFFRALMMAIFRNLLEIGILLLAATIMIVILWTDPFQPGNEPFPYAAFITASITLFIAHLGLYVLLKERGNASFNPYTFSEMHPYSRYICYPLSFLFLAMLIYLAAQGPFLPILPGRRAEAVVVLFWLLLSSFLFYHIRYGAFFASKKLNDRLFNHMLRTLKLPCKQVSCNLACKKKCPFFRADSKTGYLELESFYKKFPVAMCSENANKSFTNSIQGMAGFLLHTLHKLSTECDAMGAFPFKQPKSVGEAKDTGCLQAFVTAYTLGFSVIQRSVRAHDINRFDPVRVQVELFDLLYDARSLNMTFLKEAETSFFLLRRVCMAGVLAAGMLFDLTEGGGDLLWSNYCKTMRHMLVRLFFRFEGMAHYASIDGKRKNRQETKNNAKIADEVQKNRSKAIMITDKLIVNALNKLSPTMLWEMATNLFCLIALGRLHHRIFLPLPNEFSDIPGSDGMTKTSGRPYRDAVKEAFVLISDLAREAIPLDGIVFDKKDMCLVHIYWLLLTSKKDIRLRKWIGMNKADSNDWVLTNLNALYAVSLPDTIVDTNQCEEDNPLVASLEFILKSNDIIQRSGDFQNELSAVLGTSSQIF